MKRRSLLYGYVYLLESQGLYKIGYSYEPEKRRKQIQTGSPFPVRLVHSFRSPIFPHVERELHARYCKKRVRGEWFALDEEDVARFKSLTSMGRTPEEQAEREESDRQWAIDRLKTRTPQQTEDERMLNALMGSIYHSLPTEPTIKDVTPHRE